MIQPESPPTTHPQARREFFRRFLGGVGAGLGAWGACSSGGFAAAPPPAYRPENAPAAPGRFAERVAGHHFKLSCAGYSFRQYLPNSSKSPTMSLEDFIDFCAREELDGAELTSYYFTQTEPAYLHALKKRAFLNGLAITGTPVGNNFCLPPGKERDKEVKMVKEWVDRSALLDSPCIRIFSGGAPKGHTEEEAMQWTVECLKEASEYAGRAGVTLALENHGGLTASADRLVQLVEATASPWLGVNLDTGNFNKQPYEQMEKAAPYAVVVQLKVEVPGESGKKELTDIPRVLEILKKAGYRGVIALEYEAAEDPRTAVPRWLKELKKAVRG